MIEVAVEVDGTVAAPEQLDDIEGLFEAAHRFSEVEAVRFDVLELTRSRPRMNRPPDRWSNVTAVCASITGCLRTVSTTLVTIGALGQDSGRGGHRHPVQILVRGRRDGCQFR